MMNYTQLTKSERYQIYALIKAGLKQKRIAKILNRSESTISRELSRNRGQKGYRPKQADKTAVQRRSSAFKARKVTPQVRRWIETLVRQELSPQQVVEYLYRHKQVSLHHETIYLLIYEDKRIGGTLYQHLRILSKPNRTRYGVYDNRGKIPNRRSIDDRPAVVDRRNRIGDWEGDTIMGKGHKSALLTLVERKTLYTVIVRIHGKRAEYLATAAIRTMRKWRDRVKTITFDNGLEFARHEKIAKKLQADVYFAHPYSSWERGINENTNGLIRQYFPKGTELDKVSDAEIQFVMDRLNNRPRASRRHRSPNELFNGRKVNLLAA